MWGSLRSFRGGYGFGIPAPKAPALPTGLYPDNFCIINDIREKSKGKISGRRSQGWSGIIGCKLDDMAVQCRNVQGRRVAVIIVPDVLRVEIGDIDDAIGIAGNVARFPNFIEIAQFSADVIQFPCVGCYSLIGIQRILHLQLWIVQIVGFRIGGRTEPRRDITHILHRVGLIDITPKDEPFDLRVRFSLCCVCAAAQERSKQKQIKQDLFHRPPHFSPE